MDKVSPTKIQTSACFHSFFLCASLLGACSDPIQHTISVLRADAEKQGVEKELDCENPATHLSGKIANTPFSIERCDFRYALINHKPWLNWTSFEGGLLLLGGEQNIFKSGEKILSASSGLWVMPSLNARTPAKVFCGQSGDYYQSKNESSPDSEFHLTISGYAGLCSAQSGDGSLSLNTLDGSSEVSISMHKKIQTIEVLAAYGDTTRISFVVEEGLIDVVLATPLPEQTVGEATIESATISLRQENGQMQITCGAGIHGTVKQVPSSIGLEYDLQLEGIPDWLDCNAAPDMSGFLTLTYDPI